MWSDLIHNSQSYQRLDYVFRYSSIPVSSKENVSTHSYWVSVYSLLIHKKLFLGSERLLISTLVYALSHDFIEGLTGDIVRVFKYATPELKRAIDDAESLMEDKLDPSIKEALFTWDKHLEPQEKNLVKAIVKAADFMSLFTYMRREVLRGNREVKPFYQIMIKDLLDMSSQPMVELESVKFDQGKFYSSIGVEASNIGEKYL